MNTVFFDLDGTLTDPMLGITRSIQFALRSLSAEVPTAQALKWCIGPPLLDSLRELTNEQLAPQALALYRERFSREGLFENQLYAGIPELLGLLVDAGYDLHVASSKPRIYVEKIIEHFGLRGYFGQLFGAELDGTRSDKTELLRYALSTIGANAARCVMVGDRRFDVEGAQGNGLHCIGVTWGYGSQAELCTAGALRLAHKPMDIIDGLLAAQRSNHVL